LRARVGGAGQLRGHLLLGPIREFDVGDAAVHPDEHPHRHRPGPAAGTGDQPQTARHLMAAGAVRAAVGERPACPGRGVEVAAEPQLRRGECADRSAGGVAHRPGPGAARGGVRAGVVHGRVHLAVLPGRAAADSRPGLRGGHARRRGPVAHVVVHHGAAASPHDVLRDRHLGDRFLPGVRFGLCDDRRGPGVPHRCDRQPHLHRGVREPASGQGRRDGRGAVRRARAGDADSAALLPPSDHLRHVMSTDPMPRTTPPAQTGTATEAGTRTGTAGRSGTPRPAPRPGRAHRPGRATPSWRLSRWGANLLTYTFLIAGALLMLGPFVFSVMTALKTPEQFATSWPLTLPDPATGENFSTLFTGRYDFIVPIVVTVQVVLALLVGQMVCSILAAYAFAHLNFPGRDVIFWLYVATL